MGVIRYIVVFFLTLTCAVSNESVVLQLNWKHQFEFAGYYAALHKGFYKDANLDVIIKEADRNTNPIETVLKHQAHYGVGNSDLLLYRHKGYSPVLLAVIFQHSPLSLLTLESSKIKTPQDLIGKKILLEQNANEIMGWLKRNELDEKKLKLVNTKYDLSKLINKEVDAITVYMTTEPYMLDKMNIKYKAFHPIETQIDFYGDNLFTTEQELNDHPERVRAFREASLKGWKYAMSHPVEIAKLISKEYQDAAPIDNLMYEAKEMQSLMESDIIEPGYYAEDRWRHIADTYAELGMLPHELSFDGFFYKDRASKYPSWILNSVYISTILLAFASIVIWNFYRLNKRIKTSEEKYHGMYENAPIVFILWDTDLVVQKWNAKAQAVFGYTNEEIVGKKGVEILVPSNEMQIVSMKLLGILNKKTEFASTNKNRTKDGTIITCEWINTPIFDTRGKVEAIVSLAVDVTEKERILTRLKNKEDSFEHMIDMAPFPIVITDYTTGEMMFVNQAAAEAIKEQKSSLMSSRASDYWFDLIDREIYVKELVKKGYIENYETRFRRKNGEVFWVQMSAVRIISDNKESAFISFLDIDSRKKMEQRLKESEEKYRLLAENAYDVIWTFNADGHFTYISPSVQKLRGFTAEEAIKQTIQDAITPKSAKAISIELEKFFTKKEVSLRRVEIEQPCKDGSTIWADAVITPIKDKGGKLISVLGITRDITEQKKLREALEVKNVAVDFASDGFMITNIDGVIEYVNSSLTKITGYSANEMIGKTPSILRSGEHTDMFWEGFWTTIASGKIWKGEITNKNKNGTTYCRLVTVTPVKNQEGEIIRFIAMLQDTNN